MKRIAMDEAHTIYTAGISKHNKPAHHLAYGYFNTIQLLFLSSDAAVRFGPVQRALCLNLGLDLWFGSEELSNLGLDLEGPVQQVRSR